MARPEATVSVSSDRLGPTLFSSGPFFPHCVGDFLSKTQENESIQMHGDGEQLVIPGTIL